MMLLPFTLHARLLGVSFHKVMPIVVLLVMMPIKFLFQQLQLQLMVKPLPVLMVCANVKKVSKLLQQLMLLQTQLAHHVVIMLKIVMMLTNLFAKTPHSFPQE